MSEERESKLLNKSVDRGKYAWECVNEAENLAKKQKEEGFEVKKTDYKSYAKKFPIMILTNGFSQAMAFAFSKGFEKEEIKKEKKKITVVKAWGLLFYHVAQWLDKEVKGETSEEIYTHCKNFMGNKILKIIKEEPGTYRYYEEEALRILDWIRRIADGRILEDGE